MECGNWFIHVVFIAIKKQRQQQSSKQNKTKQTARKKQKQTNYSMHMRRDKYNVIILADTCMHM